MKIQKRVLAIHDISGVGKCSLTVALPIISLFGVEASAMPTAILSTHTGGFTNFTYRDLTDDLLKMVDHWESIGVKFDGIYTGFLGSFEQIDIIAKTIDTLKKETTIVIIDPVMADDGKLYSIFDKSFPSKMKELCSKADVLIPNITEAVLMLDEEYKKGPYTKDYIEGLLNRLKNLGAKKIILTGVFFDEKQLGVACFDTETEKIDYIMEEKIDGYFHGTGDIFASTFTGAFIDGTSLVKSSEFAVNFTVDAIKRTKEAKTEPRYGVNFEMGIPKLIKDYFG